MPMRSSAIRPRFESLASWRRAMRMILGSGGWARTGRLMKLASRFVLGGVRPHRLDRARQGSHFVAESFDVEEQGVLRPRELVHGCTQAGELVAHTGQRRLGRGVGELP